MNGRFLLDNSAWARLGHRNVDDGRVAEIAGAAEAGHLVACLPFLLEAGYSARDAVEHGELLEELLALPRVLVDERTEAAALDAQRRLARAGHHRLPPIDLLIAALADRHQLGVLQLRRRLRHHPGQDNPRLSQRVARGAGVALTLRLPHRGNPGAVPG